MPRSVSILISLVFLAAPAAAQDGSKIFFDEGDNLKALRLGVGLTF